MSGDGRDGAAARERGLALDNDDLRAENARLRASVLQRQEEILALGERLGALQARCEAAERDAAAVRDRLRHPVRTYLRAALRRLR